MAPDGQLKGGAEGGAPSSVEEGLAYTSKPLYFTHTPVPSLTSTHNLSEPSPPKFNHCPATSVSPGESNKIQVTEFLKPEDGVSGCWKRCASSVSSWRRCPSTHPTPDVDSGWAWVVFTAAFLQFFVSSGMYYSFSVFFVELLRAFGESRAKTGWVYSTNSAVHMFCGPLAGWVISRWGPRVAVMLGGLLAGLGNVMTAFAPTLDLVFFTHGFINAVGTSLNFCGWVVGLGRFWEQRRALAVGVAMSGSGFGVFFLGPLMASIVQEYGWRGSMLICAGMSFNFSVFGATIYSRKRESPLPKGTDAPGLVRGDDVANCERVGVSDDGCPKSLKTAPEGCLVDEKIMGVPVQVADRGESFLTQTRRLRDWLSSSIKSSPKNNKKDENALKGQENAEDTKPRILCSPAFWLLEAACFLSVMAITTVYAVFLDWTEWAGVSATFSSALAGSGAGDLIGRMLAGVLMGRGLPPLLLFGGIQALLAVAIVCVSLSSTPEQLVTSMVGMGVGCGVQSVLFALIPSEFGSDKDAGRVLGRLLLVTGMGALLGPPTAGVLVDQTHSYASVLILCAAAPAAASLLNIVAHCISRRFKGKVAIHA